MRCVTKMTTWRQLVNNSSAGKVSYLAHIVEAIFKTSFWHKLQRKLTAENVLWLRFCSELDLRKRLLRFKRETLFRSLERKVRSAPGSTAGSSYKIFNLLKFSSFLSIIFHFFIKIIQKMTLGSCSTSAISFNSFFQWKILQNSRKMKSSQGEAIIIFLGRYEEENWKSIFRKMRRCL